MYAILYPKTETKFNTYGLGVILSSIGTVTTQRNGVYEIYLEIDQETLEDHHYDQLIEVGMFLKAKAGIRRGLQNFEINRVVKSDDGKLQVWGEHALLARLNADNIQPKVGVEGNAEMALTVLSGSLVSGKPFEVKSDITTKNKASWSIDRFNNAKEVLAGKAGSILDVWGGEYEFDNNLITLHKRMGRKAPTALIYGRNITSIKQDERIDSTYTSVYPYAVYVAENQVEHIVTIDNFLIDSEYVDRYQHRKIKLLNFSDKFKDGEKPTKEKLVSLGQSFIKSNSIGVPNTKLEIEYEDLSRLAEYEEFKFIEELDLCDVVPVFYPKIGVTDQDARITEVVYDFINDKNTKVKIGSIGRSSNYQMGKNVQAQLDQLESKQKAINETLPYLIDGSGNRVWLDETPDPNLEHKVGDVWFDKNGRYTIIKIWDGKDWRDELNEENFKRIIDEKFSSIESKLSEVNQSISQTDQETQEKLDNFKKQLEALDLPDEDITRTLEDLERKLDRTSTRSDFALELIGSDGIKRYNKNILDGEYKRTVSLKEETTDLVASGGFKKGQTYTISFEALCKLLERHKVKLKMTLPEFIKDKRIGYYEATVKHESNKIMGYRYQGNTTDSYVLAYEGNNTLTISGNWYKTQKHNLTVTGDITKPITLEYRDGLEDNLTDGLTIEWGTESEVKFESSL
ncbi:phage tail spike protein [Facklamia languida]